MERELWSILSRHITRLDRHTPRGRMTHSVGRIVRVYLWAALHDRPVYWACERRHWTGVKPPTALPDQSTMSRRLRDPATTAMLKQLEDALDTSTAPSLIYLLDGKPLTVSRHSIDADATFGRGAGGIDRGYKLHAVYTEKTGNNRPVRWSVTPLNRCEHQEAATLLDDAIGQGYLLGDANFDANHLYEQAAHHGLTLLTPRRYAKAKGLGHHRHAAARRDAIGRLDAPSPFVRELLEQRRVIETRFAHLTNGAGLLTHLPPWIRRLHRVRMWVHAKIIIRLAKDIQRKPIAA